MYVFTVLMFTADRRYTDTNTRGPSMNANERRILSTPSSLQPLVPLNVIARQQWRAHLFETIASCYAFRHSFN